MWLDGADRITAVDDAWLGFAAANDAPELTRQAVVGVPLYERARAGLGARAIPFRCDHPGGRRYMTMSVEPEPSDGLRLEYSIEREEPRPWAPLVDRRASRSEELLRVCSWCNRAAVDGAWLELDELLRRSELFARRGPVPRLTHGLCQDCARKLRGDESAS
jgi:hypothetical protein